MSRLLLMAGAALALSAGAAIAQDYDNDASTAAGISSDAGEAVHHAARRDHGYRHVYRGPLAAGEYGRDVVYESSPTPPADAWRLTPNDPYVVTNGPVPDTPANRSRYGAPMSHAGKVTPPVGD
jgi:hypothetical protein